jgi:hypothetical protein
MPKVLTSVLRQGPVRLSSQFEYLQSYDVGNIGDDCGSRSVLFDFKSL